MAKAKKILETVAGLAAKAAGGQTGTATGTGAAAGLGVDLVGAIVEAVKRLATDSDFIKAAVAALRAAGVAIPVEKAEAAVAKASGTAPYAADDGGEPPLLWEFGGFDGGKAKVVEEAVLGKAVLKGNTLTFEWAKGDCRDLGATSKTDADHTVACLFVEEAGGGAIGGKFEWISTSRKTRSVKNIREDGYNGWPKVALDDGDGKLWFCIAGVKDDQKTSNGKRTALVEVERA